MLGTTPCTGRPTTPNQQPVNATCLGGVNSAQNQLVSCSSVTSRRNAPGVDYPSKEYANRLFRASRAASRFLRVSGVGRGRARSACGNPDRLSWRPGAKRGSFLKRSGRLQIDSGTFPLPQEKGRKPPVPDAQPAAVRASRPWSSPRRADFPQHLFQFLSVCAGSSVGWSLSQGGKCGKNPPQQKPWSRAGTPA